VAVGQSSSPSSTIPNRNSQPNAPTTGPKGSSSNRSGGGVGTAPNGLPIGSPGSGPGSPNSRTEEASAVRAEAHILRRRACLLALCQLVFREIDSIRDAFRNVVDDELSVLRTAREQQA
jgi:hypothetical protein